MVVDLTSGWWRIFVPEGLAELAALRTRDAVACSPEHAVVTSQECGSWTVILVLLNFFVMIYKPNLKNSSLNNLQHFSYPQHIGFLLHIILLL